MRNFLERHSSLYRWAGRQKADAADGWQIAAEELAEQVTHAESVLAARRLAHAAEIDDLATRHRDDIARHDKANARLRRVNKHLVGKLRESGVPASEFPAEPCPHCGALSAVPEDGHHILGSVSYPDKTVRLFCDGTEE